MSPRRLAPLAAVALLAGCGGGHTAGRATLWVTRDRGAHVLLTATVPAGESAMQALERKADVKTRYGGRFVEAIDGVAGSLTGRRDWFYFVNGIEADRSAAEYRLRPGDVEWWDYRSWRTSQSVPAVIGAFPEPFLHGYNGRRHGAFVVSERGNGPGVRALARLLRAQVRAPGFAPPAHAYVFVVEPGREPLFVARRRNDGGVTFLFAGDLRRLVSDPGRYRFRYEVQP